MLFRRREVLLPTPTGWLLLLAILATAATLLGRALPDLLTVDEPAHGPDGRGAKTLVIEGWLDARELDQALPAIRSGRYQQVLTTGGPIEAWNGVSEWKTYADRAAAHLAGRGIGPPIRAIPAPPTQKDRTYRSALSIREWARDAGTRLDAIDLYAAGIHARRSRTVFRLALGPGVEIGVLSAAIPEEQRHWWTGSRGAKAILGEALSLAWTTCCFWPATPAENADGLTRPLKSTAPWPLPPADESTWVHRAATTSVQPPPSTRYSVTRFWTRAACTWTTANCETNSERCASSTSR